MSIEQHYEKCELILDNTRSLYDRQQAISRLYMKSGDDEKFDRQLISLARQVVNQTNLSESADPFMHGEVAQLAVAHIYGYMVRDYYDEFIKWNKLDNGEIVAL